MIAEKLTKLVEDVAQRAARQDDEHHTDDERGGRVGALGAVAVEAVVLGGAAVF